MAETIIVASAIAPAAAFAVKRDVENMCKAMYLVIHAAKNPRNNGGAVNQS